MRRLLSVTHISMLGLAIAAVAVGFLTPEGIWRSTN